MGELTNIKKMKTLNEKIEEAKKNLPQKEEKRDKEGKYRKLTIVERCGKWTVLWIILWAAVAGGTWTYAIEHRAELFGTKTIVIEVARAEMVSEAIPAAKAPEEAKFEAKEGEFSAYNAEVSQTDADPFTMASGKKVYEGAIANNCLEFGSKIKVNGKIKIVEDRMNSRYGCDHFDIYMASYDEAVNFGRQNLSYEIIK